MFDTGKKCVGLDSLKKQTTFDGKNIFILIGYFQASALHT